MANYSISIILPCYNVAQYIERAVDSILLQDFTDYEVIIVNDGSPDNLLEVCKKWGGKSNFKVVTTKNQGLSQARNEGLERAQGEYVYFMDPDDYINPGMFREVIDKCHEGNYDAVHFGFQTIYEDQGGIHYDKFEKPHVYVSNQEIIKEYLPKFIGFGQAHIDHWQDDDIWSKNEFSGVWRFFFKRSVLMENNIRFRRGITLFEDKLFDALFFLYAQSIATMDKVYYNYIIKSKGLLTSSINNNEKLLRDKINGVTERALLRSLYVEERNIDIFPYYNGTVILGALEIIVRGADMPILKCIKSTKEYLSLNDVKEAFCMTNLSGLSAKLKIPALMIKYGMMPLVVLLIHLARMLHIKLNAD